MMLFHFVTIKVYNGYLSMCYGTLFTNFLVFSVVFDVDIPMFQAFNYPQLYMLVQRGEDMAPKMIAWWIAVGVY